MADNIQVPPRVKQALLDRVDGMDPQRRENFSRAMTQLNAHLASMTDDERIEFAKGIEELHSRTRNGEELTVEDLEAVSGGEGPGGGWAAAAKWILENLDWKEFKKGVVDAWNET